ncbi:neuronal acetylcholine receptor subunit non-alpha-2-like isoform X2 [Ptychodera flava]|uniref:neuronal acetylcholine receptor subunit non-alpha-2-like isoform X2 n=1 Tax=Ptychodera flava TaxID=63121 RepID=UPI003969FBDA
MVSQLSCSLNVAFLITIIHCGIRASDVSPFSRLSRDLLQDYDTDVLPVKNATDALALGFVVCLHRIDDMDEKQQMITLTAYINQRWQDKFLSWNPEDYDGITEIRFPADKVWLPDTAVLNSAQNSDGLIKSDTNVVVAHTGHVLWTVPVFLQNSCKFNIRYVPFDTQVCNLHFSSWSYERKQLEFVNTSVHLDHYQEHGEWELLSAEIDAFESMISHNPFEMSGAMMTLALKRRPCFGLLFIVVPFILISCLSLFVFLIPVESGEKMSLGITNLLTLIMFYTGVSSRVSSTADGRFPLISTFYFSAICLVLTSCLLTVLVLNIYHRKSPVPKLVHRLFFGRFGLHRFVWYVPVKGSRKCSSRGESSCGSNLAKHSILLSYPSLPSSLNSTPTMQRKFGVSDNSMQAPFDLQSSMRQTLLGIERVERHLKSKEDYDDEEYTCNSWQKIAIITDQLCFITLATVGVSITVGFFTAMSCNKAHSEFL